MAGYIGSKAVNLSTTGADINGDANIDGDLSFRDNDKIKLGAGSDLQIYHDGFNSYISDQGAGQLTILASNFEVKNPDGSQSMFFSAQGNVASLYYAGSAKLLTESSGVDILGTLKSDGLWIEGDSRIGSHNGTNYDLFYDTSDSQLEFADNAKAVFGNGSDLQIYHDAADSIILDNGTGNLKIQANDLVLKTADGVKEYLKATADGSVRIRYNNTTVLETTSTGVDITGALTSDGLTVDGTIASPPSIRISNNGSGGWSIGDETGRLQFYTTDPSALGAREVASIRAVTNQGGTTTDGTLEFWTSPYNAVAKKSMEIDGVTGDISFYEDTGTTAKFFWDASAESLGIGAFSAISTISGAPFRIGYAGSNNTTFDGIHFLSGANVGGTAFIDYRREADSASSSLLFGTSNTERMRIDSSGRVGIGTSSPSSQDTSANNLVIDDIAGNGGLTIKTPTTSIGAIHFSDGTSGTDRYRGIISYSHSDNSMRFHTDTARAMTINSSGRVGIGTSSPNARLEVEDAGNTTSVVLKVTADDSAPYAFVVGNDTFSTTDTDGLAMWVGNDGACKIDARGSGALHTFRVQGTERMRIDSSGNLLVGKTSVGLTNSGVELREGAASGFTRDDTVIDLNRTGSDGQIMRFRKNGSTAGFIGNIGSHVYIGGPSAAGLYFGGSRVQPMSNGSLADNLIDMGHPSVRFDDMYATNGTIQTSDRNEKQDIAELSDAEQRVAVAAKSLMRKFRWRESVAKKGDDARIHFGIIAQDLQAAFAAEGLDAGDYAMFISSTWWETQTEVPAVEAVAEVLDEEGNVVTEAVEAVDAYTRTDTYDTQEEAPEGAVERDRMGVRMTEILAFIIGAL